MTKVKVLEMQVTVKATMSQIKYEGKGLTTRCA